jgi:hypothetical protein
MGIDQLYASEVQGQTHRYANWLPNSPLEIGHFGSMKGMLFESLGRIEGIPTITSPATEDIDFTIHASRKIDATQEAAADAGVTSGQVLLGIGFEKEAGVSFSATETRTERVQDFKALGEMLISKIDSREFNKNHVIVVEVVHAAKATIICSSKAGAEVKFAVAAKTPINPTVMVNLNSSGSLVAERGVGFKIVGEGPIHPLFGLASIKSPLWGDRTIITRGDLLEAEGIQHVEVSDQYYLELAAVSAE